MSVAVFDKLVTLADRKGVTHLLLVAVLFFAWTHHAAISDIQRDVAAMKMVLMTGRATQGNAGLQMPQESSDSFPALNGREVSEHAQDRPSPGS